MSRWTIHHADVMQALAKMPEASFDAVLCDPPYGLSFMGKAWDHGVPSAEVWAEVLRVLKPGAFLLAFGGTRTFHRLTCAIEDAGFEIRDCVSWLYGSGFPKSMDISKALDKAACAERKIPGRHHAVDRAVGIAGNDGRCVTCGLQRGGQPGNCHCDKVGTPVTDAARTWNGYGTALKPAVEPCIVAMKPLDGTFAENALRHGVAGLNIEAGRIAHSEECRMMAPSQANIDNPSEKYRQAGRREAVLELKPEGRWPANLILDPEAGAMLDAQTGTLKSGARAEGVRKGLGYHGADGDGGPSIQASEGGASRFFYCAKASRRERDAGTGGNAHPCLKPLDLNRYLASLILPPKRDTPRRILTPFSGSGSEMIGALLAGWDEAVGIEREADYCAIAEARLAHWVGGGRTLEAEAEPGPQESLETVGLPLFSL